MMHRWLCLQCAAGRRLPLRALVGLASIVWIPLLLVGTLGWAVPAEWTAALAPHYVIPLAPVGTLDYPQNFGDRCTLVDSAVVLDFYGAPASQEQLALRLGSAAHYSGAARGVPWWAFVAWPGKRPLLDMAIEQVADESGLRVHAQTLLGLNFPRVATAIARNHPVVLNVYRSPDGTYDHSLLAYGYDTRAGRELLLVVDPNDQISYWIGPRTRWSATVTSTYIAPAGSRTTP